MSKLDVEKHISFESFLNYMKCEMTENEYGTLSEISDEIASKKPSMDFIKAYKDLSIKYPTKTIRCKIDNFIKDAESNVENWAAPIPLELHPRTLICTHRLKFYQNMISFPNKEAYFDRKMCFLFNCRKALISRGFAVSY